MPAISFNSTKLAYVGGTPIYRVYAGEHEVWSQDANIAAPSDISLLTADLSWVSPSGPSPVVITDYDLQLKFGGTEPVAYGLANELGATESNGKWHLPVRYLEYGKWRSVIYGEGKFIAIKANKFGSSPDGINWTTGLLPTLSDSRWEWTSAAHGSNGRFVAVSGSSTDPVGSNAAAMSFDGETWYSHQLPYYSNWNCLAFGNGIFVACGKQACAISTYGTAWSGKPMLSVANSYRDIAFGNGVFVALTDKNTFAVSSNGDNWSQSSIASSVVWSSIAFGNGVFTAVSTDSAGNSNYAAVSPDGQSWTIETLSENAQWKSIAFGNGKFVAVPRGKDFVSTSPNGKSWTTRSLPVGKPWQDIAFGGDRFVVVGDSGSGCTAVSLDGENWDWSIGVSAITNFGNGDVGFSNSYYEGQ